jgi:hypothetical protein
VSACITYDHVTSGDGGDRRRTHDFGLATSIPLGENLLLGIRNKYVDHEGPGDEARKGYLLDAGLLLRLSRLASLGLVGYNLVAGEEGAYPRAVGVGAGIRPVPQLLVAADGHWNLDRSGGRYGGGAEYFIAPQGGEHGFPLRAGYLHDGEVGASHLTFGLGYITPRVALDLGGRRQLRGGDETTLLFVLRLFLPS